MATIAAQKKQGIPPPDTHPMEPTEFNGLFKDIISHLYDYTVLEIHPLTQVVAPPPDYRGSRGEYLRELILAEIEYFKPEGKESFHSLEWRPYHILHKRYVEGIGLSELAQILALSGRQLRRDNSRAVQALAGRVWDRLNIPAASVANAAHPDDDQDFQSDLEILDLNEIITGIQNILEKRVAVDEIVLKVDLTPAPLKIMADRIVTRQIVISLMGYFLNFPCADEITLQTATQDQSVLLRIQSSLIEPWCRDDAREHADLLDSTRYWSNRMNGEIEINHPQEDQTGLIELTLKFPLTQQKIILVVDDQQPTHQMFQRFLSRTQYQVIGTTDSRQALALARQHQPYFITLDVMMPKVDGWEILQALKTDPATRHIPVLVCSAWAEPELARSLGAAGFLKKPVRQRDLLAALAQLG